MLLTRHYLPRRAITLSAACFLLLAPSQSCVAAKPLFPTDVQSNTWSQFQADGYQASVCGIVSRTDKPPCCGVPLGGLSTGCLDVDPIGTIGFCTIFNAYPRQPKLAQPFLGIAVGDRTWVLAAEKVVRGGLLESCVEKGRDPYYPDRQRTPAFWHAVRLPIEKVHAADEIHYWGHYPIVDVQYECNCPVTVGLRAWSPFVPGDVRTSDTPAAIFEVRLKNASKTSQKGAVALSFNGPLQDVKRSNYHDRQVFVGAPPVFKRRAMTGDFSGEIVSYENSAYALGVVKPTETVRSGRSLDEGSWHEIGAKLPSATDGDSGLSAAMDFELDAGETKTVRFLLAWHVPTWGETGTTWHRMNAKYYPAIDDVISFMVKHHEEILARIFNWQSVIYAADRYPLWLRDCLVNSLALITECGFYAQPTGPLEGWSSPEGLFGMIECPRACPQIECIPCSWYGNMPIVYFFPTLARTTLKGYREYQREDGAAPFCFGPQSDMWQGNNNHAHDNQIMLNGVCYVDLVYRLWKRTQDDSVLDHFYESVKKSTTLTATMGEKPYPVVGFPPGDKQTEWWEGWPWTGIATHAAGMHLSNLLLAEDMAKANGDSKFAEQCREWFQQGSRDHEELNWHNGSYLLFNKPQSNQSSDKIMSNQLDAEWANSFLGLKENVFRKDRIGEALETIRETCLYPTVGAVSFASRDGSKELTTYGIFPPETLILGMTYLYQGDKETGLEICRQCMENLVVRQKKEWDLPNMVNAETGEVTFGTDYYQMMILWAVPAAIDGQSIAEFCAPGGLVDRVLKAGSESNTETSAAEQN